MPITVIKRNGNREIFSRLKLLTGLVRACEKTGLDTGRLEVVIDDLEILLQQRNQREINSQELGDLVLDQLGDLSEVACPKVNQPRGELRKVPSDSYFSRSNSKASPN